MQDKYLIPSLCLWGMIAVVALGVHFFGGTEVDILEGHSGEPGLGMTGATVSDDLNDEDLPINCATGGHPF